ncbi:MAG: cell division protein ZipA C-terminal FtsZ-binding domain-containing protein [Pseudomonadota bacterium]
MMTTLQIVLAIVGVVLVGAIVVYNLVQERRFRKEAERMFSHRREDIMLGESVRSGGGDDIQPRISFGDEGAARPEVAHALKDADEDSFPRDRAPQEERADEWAPEQHYPEAQAPADEPVIAPRETRTLIEADSVQPPVPAPAPEPEPVLFVEPELPVTPPPAPPPVVPTPARQASGIHPAPDAEPVEETQGAHASSLDMDTEYVARIRFATPSMANYGGLLTTLRRIGKPVRAFGKRLDGIWEPLTSHPRASFDQVEIGLQLADRSGAVTHEQLDAFCRALYGFAAEQGGAVSCPDKQDALQAAKSLDMLCMEVDVLIGLNVVASDSRPFTSEAIRSQAEEARLVLGADGAYHAKDAFGHTLFTLANQDEQPFPPDGRGLTVGGLTLLFDVPRVADGLAVFDRMTRFGFDLAWRLEGRLVDDSGRPVTEDNLNRDRARLAAFYGRMEARGIPAGGERALRLFV